MSDPVKTPKSSHAVVKEAVQPDAGQSQTASKAEAQSSNTLTPEEQLALFEKALKEDDWGHQPC